MEFRQVVNRGTSVGRLVLLTVAALVAVAPLCSAVVADPAMDSASGKHAMGAAQHETPMVMLTNIAISGNHHGEHCTPHSCCSAALVKITRLKQADGTAVLAVIADASSESQASCSLASATGPGATPEAAVAQVPLRL